jgi:UDP-N-acetyl-2-amino-2-deoxyglucuronate dehydrogenase
MPQWRMRVGIIGTGAVAHKHAQAYRNIGYSVAGCSGLNPARGKQFAEEHGCAHFERWQDLCSNPQVDLVDVCTFPDFRLQPVEWCARTKKHVQVEKPIAINLEIAQRMIESARAGGILLHVVSQHRFDEAAQFLKRALDAGRLGKILQADAYVKWYRPPSYYARPVKGAWATEGGGALITQAIHQVDLLLWLAGPAIRVCGEWRLRAVHQMESEDVLSALIRYASGATGVIQASTAFWPGYPERVEIHGTKGTAVIAGDRLATWDVMDDSGERLPIGSAVASGASDPLAISLEPFERQFLDFGEAIRTGRAPLVTGAEGYRALELVDAIYRSFREAKAVEIQPGYP